jgi:hypothetical protein
MNGPRVNSDVNRPTGQVGGAPVIATLARAGGPHRSEGCAHMHGIGRSRGGLDEADAAHIGAPNVDARWRDGRPNGALRAVRVVFCRSCWLGIARTRQASWGGDHGACGSSSAGRSSRTGASRKAMS